MIEIELAMGLESPATDDQSQLMRVAPSPQYFEHGPLSGELPPGG